jgi:hypothetical protein
MSSANNMASNVFAEHVVDTFMSLDTVKSLTESIQERRRFDAKIEKIARRMSTQFGYDPDTPVYADVGLTYHDAELYEPEERAKEEPPHYSTVARWTLYRAHAARALVAWYAINGLAVTGELSD